MLILNQYKISLNLVQAEMTSILFDDNSSTVIIEKLPNIQFLLKIPEPGKTAYYFFHQVQDQKKKMNIQNIKIEQIQISQFSYHFFKCGNYKLLGGVKIWTQLNFKQSERYKVYINPLGSNDIQSLWNVHNKYFTKEKYIPYLIVRSFQKGYPLKINQQIKFAKTEFKIIDIQDKTTYKAQKSQSYDFKDQKNRTQKSMPKDLPVQINKNKLSKQANHQEVLYPIIWVLKDDNSTFTFSCIKQKMVNKQYIENHPIKFKTERGKFIIKRFLENTIINQKQFIQICGHYAEIQHNYQRGFFINDSKSKYGTLLYERNAQVQLSSSEIIFQINKKCFSFKLKPQLDLYLKLIQ